MSSVAVLPKLMYAKSPKVAGDDDGDEDSARFAILSMREEDLVPTVTTLVSSIKILACR